VPEIQTSGSKKTLLDKQEGVKRQAREREKTGKKGV
jgi:hypothetical protein